jgi:hypothetical protein
MRSQPVSRFPVFLVLTTLGALALGMLSLSGWSAQKPQANTNDARLQKAWRFQRDGWTYVHLEGAPAEIGYQHGFDVVALNAFEEVPDYYVPWLEDKQKRAGVAVPDHPPLLAPGNAARSWPPEAGPRIIGR